MIEAICKICNKRFRCNGDKECSTAVNAAKKAHTHVHCYCESCSTEKNIGLSLSSQEQNFMCYGDHSEKVRIIYT